MKYLGFIMFSFGSRVGRRATCQITHLSKRSDIRGVSNAIARASARICHWANVVTRTPGRPFSCARVSQPRRVDGARNGHDSCVESALGHSRHCQRLCAIRFCAPRLRKTSLIRALPFSTEEIFPCRHFRYLLPLMKYLYRSSYKGMKYLLIFYQYDSGK